MNEKVKSGFIRVAIIFFVSFVETAVLLLILFALERAGIFMIQVVGVDGVWVYPYESGGFFFGLILVSNTIGSILWALISNWNSKRKEIPCCDNVTCLGGDLPMCSDI